MYAVSFSSVTRAIASRIVAAKCPIAANWAMRAPDRARASSSSQRRLWDRPARAAGASNRPGAPRRPRVSSFISG